MLYFGENLETLPVTVPDFMGMSRQQAEQAAEAVGLYTQIIGNPGSESPVTATAQSIKKNTSVPVGTTIRLEFTDQTARD